MTQLLIDRETVEQLVEDILQINREMGKGGVACDISNRAYPAIKRSLDTLRAALANAEQPAGDVVRYCYECGSIGEVPEGKRDCCPDGSHAKYINGVIAEQAQGGFNAMLEQTPRPVPQGEPVMFAWKRDDGTYYDASGAEHSCGMHPLFAHAEPAQQVPEGWMKWLKKMEWNNWRYDRYGDSKPHCPECGQEKEDGHKEDCELAAMLGAAPAAKL